MPHCVTALSKPSHFMPAWTHAANQTAMQDCLIELVYLGTTMKGYQALRFKLHKCFIMFAIFTIINLIMSLWAPAQSCRGCGYLNPLCATGLASCLAGTQGTLHNASP